jgi:hypothetical protein
MRNHEPNEQDIRVKIQRTNGRESVSAEKIR